MDICHQVIAYKFGNEHKKDNSVCMRRFISNPAPNHVICIGRGILRPPINSRTGRFDFQP